MISFFRVQKADLEQVLEANDGSGVLDEDEEDLRRALALSRQQIDMEDEEADLRRAIQLSMQGIDILSWFFPVLKNRFRSCLVSGVNCEELLDSLTVTEEAVALHSQLFL